MNRVKLHKPKAQTLTVASCYSDEILEAQIVTFIGADTREGLLRDQAQFRDLARYLWREQARSRDICGYRHEPGMARDLCYSRPEQGISTGLGTRK